jgi:hypothetical protein
MKGNYDNVEINLDFQEETTSTGSLSRISKVGSWYWTKQDNHTTPTLTEMQGHQVKLKIKRAGAMEKHARVHGSPSTPAYCY